MMSSVTPLEEIQARREFAERDGSELGRVQTYCDEYGTWLRQANGHWQLISPALTSMAMV